MLKTTLASEPGAPLGAYRVDELPAVGEPGDRVCLISPGHRDHLEVFRWDLLRNEWVKERPVLVANAISTVELAADAVTAEKMAVELELRVGQQLRSNSYAPGVSGFRITGAGDAEFNDVRIRGDLLIDLEKSIRIPFTAFRPQSSSEPFDMSSGYLDPGSVGTSRRYFAALVLPKGIILEQLDARLYRETGDDVAEVTLWRGDASETNGISVAVDSVTHSTTGWATVTAGPGIGETVGDSTYTLEVELRADANIANQARLLWVELHYRAPSVAYGL